MKVTNIPECIVLLEFSLEPDVPPKYVKKWNLLKAVCESGAHDNVHVTKLVLRECKLKSNREQNILNRCEGGIGGESNLKDKQIRYVESHSCLKRSKSIILICMSSINQLDHWSIKELFDIIYGFVSVFNFHMTEKCVEGKITLENVSERGTPERIEERVF